MYCYILMSFLGPSHCRVQHKKFKLQKRGFLVIQKVQGLYLHHVFPLCLYHLYFAWTFDVQTYNLFVCVFSGPSDGACVRKHC